MKRLLALLGAVAMVVVAVVLRSNVIAPDEGGGLSLGGGSVEGTVVCATELAEACKALRGADAGVTVRTAHPGETVDQLAGGGTEGDVWLAPRPWIEVAGLLADDALGEPTAVLARSPLVVVAAPAFGERCADGATVWRCLGDDPTAVRPGIEGRDTTSGLWARAAAGSAFFGGSFASNDFDARPVDVDDGPTFAQWLGALIDEVPRSQFGTPLATIVRERATFDLAVAVEAVAVPTVAGSRYEDDLQVLYPSPMITVDIAAAPLAAGDADAARSLLEFLEGGDAGEALASAGWRVEGEALLPELADALELPDSDGLPAAGVLVAIRQRLP